MLTFRQIILLAASVLLSSEAQAQAPKQVNQFEAALAQLRPAAGRVASRGIQQTVSKPGRGIRTSWNTNTQAWSTSAVVETYSYDSRANLTQETFADSATAQLTSRSQYAYDAQNRNTEELYQQWQNGAWVNTGRFTITYDAQGNPTQKLDQQWQNGTWVTTQGNQYLNTYANNVLTEQIIKTWANGAFENDARTTYTLVNGQWSELVRQEWVLGAWENQSRIIDILWFDWAAMKPASFRQQDWQGTWADDLRFTNTYSANGTTVQIAEEKLGAGWAVASRVTDTFDNFGNYLGVRFESWDGTAWDRDYEERDLLTYTPANEVRRRISQVYSSSNGNTTFENKERVNYSNFLSITLGTAPAVLAAQTQLYPNPTTGTATLVVAGLKQAGSVKLEVLNALGQSVLQTTTRPSTTLLNETLDLRSLPAGVYSVRLHTAEGSIVKRLVKQ